MEAYGDGYMAPEEEWEREGLLDPAWEKQQKKVSECYHSRDFSLFFPPFFLFLSLSSFLCLETVFSVLARRREIGLSRFLDWTGNRSRSRQ